MPHPDRPHTPDAPSASHEPAPLPAGQRSVKIAIAGAAMIPTVLGAIAAGATEHEVSTAKAETTTPVEVQLPAAQTPDARDARAIVPIRRLPGLPLTPEHKAMPAAKPAPDFSFHPRFKAMLADQRGMAVTTGRTARTTLYQVAPGDTLYGIAKLVLGNGNRWRELYQANRGKVSSPSLIHVGMTLTIPGAVSQERPSTYEVARGDSLYTIAARTLKNGNRWREIAALNKARLKGGTMIYPSQVLLLPSV